MTLSAFPEKIPETRKQFLIFCPSHNVAPKLTGQSRSHSVSRVPLQISLAHFFVFDLPPKLRIVHIRKKFNIIFSKMALMILYKFCEFIVHSKPNNMALTVFSGKILDTRKIVFKFSVCHVTQRLNQLIKSCSHSIFGVPLLIFRAFFFLFSICLQN